MNDEDLDLDNRPVEQEDVDFLAGSIARFGPTEREQAIYRDLYRDGKSEHDEAWRYLVAPRTMRNIARATRNRLAAEMAEWDELSLDELRAERARVLLLRQSALRAFEDSQGDEPRLRHRGGAWRYLEIGVRLGSLKVRMAREIRARARREAARPGSIAATPGQTPPEQTPAGETLPGECRASSSPASKAESKPGDEPDSRPLRVGPAVYERSPGRRRKILRGRRLRLPGFDRRALFVRPVATQGAGLRRHHAAQRGLWRSGIPPPLASAALLFVARSHRQRRCCAPRLTIEFRLSPMAPGQATRCYSPRGGLLSNLRPMLGSWLARRVGGGVLLTAIAWALGGTSLQAGPTLEAPDQPLEVRPDPEVAQLRDLAQQLFEAAAAAVKVYQKKLADKTLVGVDPREIGKTHVSIKQLRRAAERLKIWGEGAAIDYLRRAEHLDVELQTIIDSYKNLPGGMDKLKGAAVFADNVLKQRQGELAPPRGKIAKMANDQKWEEAETAINDAIDDIEIAAVWLDRNSRFERIKPFLKAYDVVQPKVLERREQRAHGALLNAFRQVVPNFDQFFLDLGKAAGELKTKPETTFDGKNLSGPELARAAIARFRALHLAAIRARGLGWARGWNEEGQMESDLERLLVAQGNSAARLLAVLAEIVEADAQRAAGDAAAELYRGYLPPLGELVSQLPDEAAAKAIDAALEKLAAKHLMFFQEVVAYRRATGEVLRWRSLAAASAAKKRKLAYQPALPLVLETARGGGTYKGLVTADSASMGDAVLLGPAGDFLRQAQTKIAQQKVLLTSGIGAPGSPQEGGTTLFGRYEPRVASQVTIAPPPAELEGLKADLLVNPMNGPLTLAAAAALAGAERGDAVEWGLTVTGCELRPLVTTWATLPEKGAAWFPPAPFAREKGAASDGPVVIVLSGGVKWVRGKYVFWEIERGP